LSATPTVRNIYSIFAVLLPVALGLGLVYLSSAGRIDTTTAIIGAVAIVLVMGGAVAARDSATRQELGDDE
jgi:hypothetical protein